jgi:hypothetical protein
MRQLFRSWSLRATKVLPHGRLINVPYKRDFYKAVSGKKKEELTRRPHYKEITDRFWRQTQSKYPLRSVGQGVQGEVVISEEERNQHTHVLGAPNEGKSKYLEGQIIEDIKRGNGLTFIDSSSLGSTLYSVLKYCAKIGYDKVCLIDPFTIHSLGKLTAVQPFHYEKSYKEATVSNIWNALRVLFKSDDTQTPQLKRYLSALLGLLWEAEMTLHETIYFSDWDNPLFRGRRNAIMRWVDNNYQDDINNDLEAIKGIFNQRSSTRFDRFFSSTIGRLDPLWSEKLSLIFGAETGVDFMEMIRDKWVILVNTYPGLGMGQMESRLLGTMVIHELIFAAERLSSHGWKGRHYLYIDEAGRMINDTLIDMMEYRRHLGFAVTFAHQGFFQFERRYVEAVGNLTKIKVMFNTPDAEDRKKMIKSLGYGGNIPPELAAWANKDLPQGTAIIRKGKELPLRVTTNEVKEVTGVSNKAFEAYKLKCLSIEGTHTPQDVRNQFIKRLDHLSPRTGAGAKRRAGGNPMWDRPQRSAAASKPNGKGRPSKKG